MGGNKSVKIDGVTLTLGNSKLGRVLNISLPPTVSCDTSMPCFMRNQCYAMKRAYNRYGTVREAWNGNWNVWMDRPIDYFRAIKAAVAKTKPDLFRWHTGGDIPCTGSTTLDALSGSPSVWYIDGMRYIAYHFPDTKFLAFTKRYDVARAFRKRMPALNNLSIVLSAWPGVPLDGRTRRAWPVCYIYDPKNPDPRIPKSAYKCPGSCDKCRVCFGLKPGEAVVIKKH